MATAILIDGGFFLKRYSHLLGNNTPEKVAKDLFWMCCKHLEQEKGTVRKLYRIFFYDCPPLTKKAHHLLTGKAIDFSKSPTALWRNAFHKELIKKRKVALRLGYLSQESAKWVLKEGALKDLVKGKITVGEIQDNDVEYQVRQKGIDVRIGVDISTMALKGQVDQIVLVTGDSDFVPASKLARREGIDIILDPMWCHIREDLFEHIDGLKTVINTEGPNKCVPPR